MPPRRILYALAALLIAAAGAARAQTTSGTPLSGRTPTRDKPFPVIDDPRRWGPFLMDLRFVLENLGYDDNIYLTPSSAPADQRKSDWILRVAPEVWAQTTFGPRTALTMRDKVTGELFATYDDLSHWDNEFEAQFDLLLGPLLLTTRGRDATVRWRPGSEFRNRVEQNDQYLGQRARLFLGPKVDIMADWSTSNFRYSDPGELYIVDIDGDGTPDGDDIDGDGTVDTVGLPVDVVLDRDQTKFQSEVGWRPTGRTRLFLRGEWTDADFEEVNRDSEERRLVMGLEFRPDARISGRFTYGLARLEEASGARNLEPYEGPISEISVTYRPTGSTRLALRWDRLLYFSTSDRNLYYVARVRGLALDTYLGRAWGLQGGATYTRADYPEAGTLAPNVGVVRQDTITDYYGGVLYRTRSSVEIGLRIGRRERESNYVGIDDDQSYFTTTGRYAF